VRGISRHSGSGGSSRTGMSLYIRLRLYSVEVSELFPATGSSSSMVSAMDRGSCVGLFGVNYLFGRWVFIGRGLIIIWITSFPYRAKSVRK
jgi:hypothetical protein